MGGKIYNINEWYALAHPLFIRHLKGLAKEGEKLKAESPDGYKNKKAAKRFAAIWHLIYHRSRLFSVPSSSYWDNHQIFEYKSLPRSWI